MFHQGVFVATQPSSIQPQTVRLALSQARTLVKLPTSSRTVGETGGACRALRLQLDPAYDLRETKGNIWADPVDDDCVHPNWEACTPPEYSERPFNESRRASGVVRVTHASVFAVDVSAETDFIERVFGILYRNRDIAEWVACVMVGPGAASVGCLLDALMGDEVHVVIEGEPFSPKCGSGRVGGWVEPRDQRNGRPKIHWCKSGPHLYALESLIARFDRGSSFERMGALLDGVALVVHELSHTCAFGHPCEWDHSKDPYRPPTDPFCRVCDFGDEVGDLTRAALKSVLQCDAGGDCTCGL